MRAEELTEKCRSYRQLAPVTAKAEVVQVDPQQERGRRYLREQRYRAQERREKAEENQQLTAGKGSGSILQYRGEGEGKGIEYTHNHTRPPTIPEPRETHRN